MHYLNSTNGHEADLVVLKRPQRIKILTKNETLLI